MLSWAVPCVGLWKEPPYSSPLLAGQDGKWSVIHLPVSLVYWCGLGKWLRSLPRGLLVQPHPSPAAEQQVTLAFRSPSHSCPPPRQNPHWGAFPVLMAAELAKAV